MVKKPKKSKLIGGIPKAGTYDEWVQWQTTWREQRQKGEIVLKGEDMVWEQGRHALLKHYITPHNWDEIAAPGWLQFIQELHTNNGKHKHQGGICIFVLEGKGHTVVDGVRHDWKAGDCVLLPLKPGGVEHQHFNDNPKGPSRWMCFDFVPLHVLAGMDETVNIQAHPDWKGKVIFKEETK